MATTAMIRANNVVAMLLLHSFQHLQAKTRMGMRNMPSYQTVNQTLCRHIDSTQAYLIVLEVASMAIPLHSAKMKKPQMTNSMHSYREPILREGCHALRRVLNAPSWSPLVIYQTHSHSQACYKVSFNTTLHTNT